MAAVVRACPDVQVAAAPSHTSPHGHVVRRVGLWPAGGAPVVLSVDEIAVALAVDGAGPRQRRLGAAKVAGRAVFGMRAAGGRARLRELTESYQGEGWPRRVAWLCGTNAMTLWHATRPST